MQNWATFISEHETDDTSRLLLSHTDWPSLPDGFSSDCPSRDYAVSTLECRRKLKGKLPEWHSQAEMVYPTRLCAEQCSSSATAAYKAALALKIADGKPLQLADLTGGLGVDSWAFSGIADHVLYNEMNSSLVAAAKHNFQLLGRTNVLFSCQETVPGALDRLCSPLFGSGSDGSSGKFCSRIIFMDPARRASDGKKVFLLEDCSPDVLTLADEVFALAENLLLKLSPMADINMALDRLNASTAAARVREVHVVAFGGECKELLVWMQKGWTGECRTFICEDGQQAEVSASASGLSLLQSPDELNQEGMMLFEPGKAVTKAAAFNWPCSEFGLRKLGRFTHIYAGASVPDAFGKSYRILEVLPFCGKSVKDAGKRYPQAEVTARNLPITSDELRKKLKVRSGGSIHIFALRTDFSSASSQDLLLICSR